MWVKRRHRIVFTLLRPFFWVFLRLRFGYRAKRYPLEKRPYLILSNHQSTLDPFNIAISFKRPIYYMASEDLFTNKFIGGLISYLVAPIPKKKSNADMKAIKNCIKVVREGGTIVVFPEGNRTYSGKQCYIDPAIVKLVKLLKVPLVLYNIHGGYGVEPRWAANIRKGKSYGCVKEVLDLETIEKMDNETLLKRIKDSLDVREAPSDTLFRSRKQAEKLERVLYLCPNCGKVGGIYSKEKAIGCQYCDLDVHYNDNLTFTGTRFNTVNDWYTYQEDWINNYQLNNNEAIFTDEIVKIYDVSNGNKKALIGYGKLEITKEKLILSRNDSSYSFLLNAINSMTVVGKHKLNFYANNQTYQIKGEKNLNVLKYMQIFYKIKGENNELFRL